MEEDTPVAVIRSIERIMNNISESFEYEKHFMACAKEYTETLIDFHGLLLSNSVYLNHFRTMLIYDVSYCPKIH